MAAIAAETCWWENCEYNISSIGVHFVGYLYIMDLVNAWKVENMSILNGVEPRYNDIGLYDTSPITSHIPINSSVLYAFFWVIPRRLNFICRRFGTLCLFHLHRQVGVKNENNSSHLPAYEDGTNRVFRNVGIWNSDAGELPRRKHTTFRTRRKFEIKNNSSLFAVTLHFEQHSFITTRKIWHASWRYKGFPLYIGLWPILMPVYVFI